ncbi:MAG: bactofilin family protein [Steroidobacteraceae bacterium]
MFNRQKSPALPKRVDTLIAKDARLKGDLSFTGGLHLDGRIDGNVISSSADGPGTLWVGEQGAVIGLIDVVHAVIHGEVVGDVCGRERVVLGRTARVKGDVRYGTIEMTLGASVEGRLIPLASSTPTLALPSAASGGLFDAPGSDS